MHEPIKRRALLIATGAWLAAAAALTSLAQTGKAPRRIGILGADTQAGQGPFFDVFRTSLRQLGYAEGRDVVIETRWAEGKPARHAALAAELIALDPAVIVTSTSAAVAALKKATSSIPIVFASVAEPVEQPERFQLIVNMKTANAIGVSLSPVTMLRANRVIE